VCNSAQAGCGRTLNPSGIPKCTSDSCLTSLSHVSGIDVYSRSCSAYLPNGCTDYNQGGVTGKICVCNTNLCNADYNPGGGGGNNSADRSVKVPVIVSLMAFVSSVVLVLKN